MSQFTAYQVENLKEVLLSEKDDVERILKELAGYVENESKGNMDGLTISDLGNKISSKQGELKVINRVLYMLNH